MSYDYKAAVRSDVEDWIQDNLDELKDFSSPYYDDVYSYLQDTLFTEDSVTGNGSGSYTFSRALADEYFHGDPKARVYVKELAEEWCEEGMIGEKALDEEWEWFDVSIRCWLLGEVIGELADEGYIEELINEE